MAAMYAGLGHFLGVNTEIAVIGGTLVAILGYDTK